MEAKPKARGPYKKHKAGYKISVSYELYSSKKQQEGLANPLYIRVRAKKQQSYFRSQIPLCFASNSIDRIIQDPLIGSFIEQETKLIEGHLGNYIDKFGEYFIISSWLVDFKEFLSLRTLPDIVEEYVNRDYHANLLRNKSVDYADFRHLVPHKSNLADSLALAKILRAVGVDGFNKTITAITSCSKVSSFFATHLNRWVHSELEATHCLGGGLIADFVFFNDRLDNRIHELSSEAKDNLLPDLQILKNIYESKI
jgi:hypothetical protein